MSSIDNSSDRVSLSTNNPRTITIRDVTRRYGWGRTKTYQLIGEGRLKAVKMGARLLILVDSCEALLASLPAAEISAPSHIPPQAKSSR